MVGLTLPQCVHLPDKKALHLNQQHLPADFEKIITLPGKVIRYYSDEPCVCVGEWIRKQFDDEAFVYIEHLDTKTAYAVFVKDGEVIKEHCGNIDDIFSLFTYFALQSHLYLSSDEILAAPWQVQYPESESFTVIEPLDIKEVDDEFHLLSLEGKEAGNERRKQLLGGALAVLLALSGFGLYKVLNPPPPPAPPPPNPVEIWRESLFSQTPAAPALNELATLLSYLYLLPQEWKIDSTAVSSNTITAMIAPRTSKAMQAPLELYLKHYPDVAKLFDKDSLTFTLALKSRPPELWYRLGGFGAQLSDTLLLLGADRVEKTKLPSLGELEKTQYHFTFTDVPYAMLKNLGELFEDKPITIDSLTLTQGSFFSFVTLDMTITLEGLPSGT
ncbi:hypothetical protein ACPV5G_19625 [Photobacterium damselae]|uniref:hypothetical protein n=1 Tax=Photobacterium damselae TaxID=38293 RepID=UPI004068DB67